jgi:hypothetical protein
MHSQQLSTSDNSDSDTADGWKDGLWALTYGRLASAVTSRRIYPGFPQFMHLVHRQRSLHIILPDLVLYVRNIGFICFMLRKVAILLFVMIDS